jgi:hypothetical protein
LARALWLRYQTRMRSRLSVLLLASASLLVACGGATPPPGSPAGAVGAMKAPGEAKFGDRS